MLVVLKIVLQKIIIEKVYLKDKHVNKHLGKYMRVAKLRDFLTKLGAPLGIVLWDARGMTKYETIKDEVRRMSTPGLGISYRRMQYILCIHAMAEDPACEMPLDEYEKRQTELDAVARMLLKRWMWGWPYCWRRSSAWMVLTFSWYCLVVF